MIRARECTVAATDGRPALVLPLVEVETTARELRLRIARLRCDVTAAAVLAAAGR